jgi:hypothetical protein
MEPHSPDRDQRTVEEILREDAPIGPMPVALKKSLWIVVIAAALVGVGISLFLYFGN